MKYFITDAERVPGASTAFLEFSKGYTKSFMDCECWSPDSIYIHEDKIEGTRFVEMMLAAVPGFDYYDVTPIGKRQWNRICRKAREFGGRELEIIQEAEPWVEENFKENRKFTILGI